MKIFVIRVVHLIILILARQPSILPLFHFVYFFVFFFLLISSWCNICDRYFNKLSHNVRKRSGWGCIASGPYSRPLPERMVSNRFSRSYSIWFIAGWQWYRRGKISYTAHIILQYKNRSVDRQLWNFGCWFAK